MGSYRCNIAEGFSWDIPCSEHGTDDCKFRFFTRKKVNMK